MTFSIMTLDFMSYLCLMGLFVTLSINDVQHKRHSASQKCHYAECRDFLFVLLNFIMLSIIMLSIIMLSVIMLSVMIFLLLC
jgi:hypothetical protein